MFQGVAKNSAAFRVMQQMGWEEGIGLGKDNQGMKEHLRVKNKQDTAGIGLDKKNELQTNWKLNTVAYDSILENLKVVVGKAAKSDDDLEEDFEDKVANVVEARQIEELGRLKVTHPRGRYKTREKGKMLGSYTKTELAAILCVQGGAGGKAVIQTTPQIFEVDKVLLDSIVNIPVEKVIDQDLSKEASDSVKEEPALVSKMVCKSQTHIESVGLQDDWWGSKYGFVRAGHLGATCESQKTERTSFHEKDQEELCKLAFEKATRSKQGLGRGSQTSKSLWMGKRKALDLGNGEDSEFDEQSGKSDRKDATTKCVEDIKSEKCTKAGNEKGVLAANDVGFERKSKTGVWQGNLKSSSWKKICKQLLTEAPLRTLSLKRLEKRAVANMLLTCGTEVQQDVTMDSLKQKLEKSSRFVVEGKKVTLLQRK